MASVPTIEVCKEDGSNRRRINEAQFGEYEQRGYRHLNREGALSDTPPNPEDTHPNGKDPIDPPSGDTSAEFPVGSGSPEDETIGKPSAFTD